MYDAPHYLYGDARVRWHKRQANKAFGRGAVAGGAAGLMAHPKTKFAIRMAGSQFVEDQVGRRLGAETGRKAGNTAYLQSDKAVYGLGAVAAHQAASGGMHYYKAKKYEREYNTRKKRSKVDTFHSTHQMSGTASTGSAYYTRQVNGKTQRVRKGR